MSATRKLLVLTGPQGSGNHLMAKLFSLHQEVGGWKELLGRYWIGHDEERFSRYWAGHADLDTGAFAGADHWVTSVSCPFVDNGVTKMPDYARFIGQASRLGFEVTVGLIVRDANIVRHQQKRVRGGESLPLALDAFEKLRESGICPVHFLDYEAAYLYKGAYLAWLGRLLDFPVDAANPMVGEILKEDANAKYVAAVESHWLDEEVKKASRPRSRG